MLDLAGLDIPEEMQGNSLVPLLEGKEVKWRDKLYYHYYEYPGIHMVKRHYGIRTKKYKLIHFYYDIDEWELFDLEKDPKEMTNLYHNPDYAVIRKTLHEDLIALRKEYKDSTELDQQFITSDLERLKNLGWD